MNTKLTLSIEVNKIKKAKRLSKKKGKSVSKLFEEFLDNMDKKESKPDFDINKIIGAFGANATGLDLNQMKWEYLKEKHGL